MDKHVSRITDGFPKSDGRLVSLKRDGPSFNLESVMPGPSVTFDICKSLLYRRFFNRSNRSDYNYQLGNVEESGKLELPQRFKTMDTTASRTDSRDY